VKQLNSICLAGPITRVKPLMFGDFGFVNATIGGASVKITVSPAQDQAFIANMECATAAIIVDAYFNSAQNKKDASKWYYDVCAYPKSVLILATVPDVFNQATLVGKVVTTGPAVPNTEVHNWGMVACGYFAPKDKQYKHRMVPIIANEDLRPYLNQGVLVSGVVNNKHNGVFRAHVGVTKIWQAYQD